MSDIFGTLVNNVASLASSIVEPLSLIGDAAANFALIMTSGRSIGGIIPNVVIDEVNRDTAVLTQHPVEIGTPVSDHYYLMGPLYELRCGWSDAPVGPGYVLGVYEQLQSLMTSRKPFDIVSGKRIYTNMMFLSLAVHTDIESEYALMVAAVMQKCIMVDVSTMGVGGTGVSANSNGSQSLGVQTPAISAAVTGAGGTIAPNGDISFPTSVSAGGTVQLSPTTGVNPGFAVGGA
jgi:hypothetical protein